MIIILVVVVIIMMIIIIVIIIIIIIVIIIIIIIITVFKGTDTSALLMPVFHSTNFCPALSNSCLHLRFSQTSQTFVGR